ncbi:MAG: nucleotidyltransferase domain-containing protein [Candidatus Omnitrophica bacterium]|nr:nucleotidyltransferase domain-containing protein [Candidatus Omnitrophota bacterium]
MRKEKINDFKEKAIRILDNYLGNNYLLFVFGSCVKGGTLRSSDIDLAVYRKETIPGCIMVQAKEALEEGAGTLRDIDLINLTDKNVGVNLLQDILEEGVIWKEARSSKELLKNLKKRLINSGK